MVAVKIIGRVCGHQDQYGDVSMNAFEDDRTGTGRETRSHGVLWGREKEEAGERRRRSRGNDDTGALKEHRHRLWGRRERKAMLKFWSEENRTKKNNDNKDERATHHCPEIRDSI